MPTAEVVYDPVMESYEIKLNSYRFEAIREIVACITQFIPASDRAYDPLSKTWTILKENSSRTINYWDILKPIIEHHSFCIGFAQKEVKTTPQEYAQNFFYEQTSPSGTQTEDAAAISQKLSVFLGVEIKAQELTDLKCLYKQKARELHPDLGGDAAKMSELNRLWTLYTQGGVQ